MHNDCIVKDVRQAWIRLTDSEVSQQARSNTVEVNGNEDTGGTMHVATSTRANGSGKPQQVNGSRSAKAREVGAGESAWEGSLEVKLQIKTEGEDESREITGKAVITDLRKRTWEQNITCLFCRKPL